MHYATKDPFRTEDDLNALGTAVRSTGGDVAFFDYPVSEHLFTDDELPAEYDESATSLLLRRALTFLDR